MFVNMLKTARMMTNQWCNYCGCLVLNGNCTNPTCGVGQ